MTLTEHERQMLQQIARDLARDDPRLARLLAGTRHTRRARRQRSPTTLILTLATLAAVALALALALGIALAA